MAERHVKTSNDFFDILDQLRNNTFVCIGYVTGANLDVPKVKRKNPETNRMKGYPDYSVFNKEGYEQEIGALVKITSYNFRYYNRKEIAKQYANIKAKKDNIRTSFGLEPIGTKDSYKATTNWSDRAPEVYVGNNDSIRNHSYNPQNTYGASIKSVTYVVGNDGKIIRELAPEEVKPYIKAKADIEGVAALRKMGAEENQIQDYIQQIQDLKFTYKNFESNSILWMAATVNGEKIIYINNALQRNVDNIDINPADFRAIARERYQISLNDLTEWANKNNALINEARKQITKLVKEELNKYLQNILKQ